MAGSEHIVASFDSDLEGIQGLIMRMGGLVEQAIADAAKALDTSDIELAKKVRDGDRAIDELDQQISEVAANIIARRQPIARDLRVVLTVFRISNNLERIGDYAKNIAKRSEAIFEHPPVEGTSASLRRMARQVELMLKDVLDAYIQQDAEKATDVRERDIEVDQMYTALFREYLTFMMEDPRNISSCMHLHFIAKNIERMGDHTTSIAEEVIYLVTGIMPTDERPKSTEVPNAPLA